MAYLIGTDEAGYGPNLGPLTVAGSIWQVPDRDVNLYELLAAAVSDRTKPDRLTIADSKVIYSSSGSISRLETMVMAILYAIHGRVPTDWQDLVGLVFGARKELVIDECWTTSEKLALPLAADLDTAKRLGDLFVEVCYEHEVMLLELNCRPVFPTEFNQGIDQLGNKATLLSNVTFSLVRDLKNSTPEPAALKIVCDKHGGRSKYSSLISEYLTDEFVWIEDESVEVSAYRWIESEIETQASFVAKGESFLPTALSSMVAKYTREVFMELWNNFWQLKIPELKATKGYPMDAKRFKKDIAQMQQSLGIADETIWRKR